MIVETPSQLVARIERAAEAEGIAASTWAQRHFRNAKMIGRLKKGEFVSRKTYLRLVELIGPPEQAAV